jgi:hypothetical protein
VTKQRQLAAILQENEERFRATFEQAAVGVPARGVEDGVFGLEEPREGGFEFLVRLLGAADEPDRGQPVPPLVERMVRRGNHLGVVCQAKIIVRTHVQNMS